MPTVILPDGTKKKFPYTPEGEEAARRFKKEIENPNPQTRENAIRDLRVSPPRGY